MKIKTTIMFDEDSYTKLKDFAHTNNESIGTVVRTAVDYLLKRKIINISTVSLSITSPSISSTSESLPIKEIPKEENTLNIHLSGKVKTCPFCNEAVPVELAQKHYNDKHEGA